MTKVLLISINAIGDTYISLSCLNPLKSYFGDVEITLLCDEEASFLLAPFKIKGILFNKNKLLSLFKIIMQLRKINYSYCLSFFPGRLNTLLAIFCKAKRKIFYLNYKKVEDWYASKQTVYDNYKKTNIFWAPEDNYLNRIKLILNFIMPSDYLLAKPILVDKSSRVVNSFGYEYVVINSNSKEKAREISPNTVMEISNYLANNYNIKSIIVDFENKFINCNMSNTKIYNNKDFYNTINLLIKSFLVITIDSFIIHLVDAYKIPSLCLFGPTSPSSVLEGNTNARIIKKTDLSLLKLEEITNILDDLIVKKNK